MIAVLGFIIGFNFVTTIVLIYVMKDVVNAIIEHHKKLAILEIFIERNRDKS